MSTSRTFRLFISSTFSDMEHERGILHEHVFPELTRLCASRGAGFQAVDLRWGVNEESQLDHKTMDICLGEIDRCQRLSPKPNFLVLLGDRYGWEPVPARIPSGEFDVLRAKASSEQAELLDRWYVRDDNAVPSDHMLVPRDEDDRWAPEEERLRKAVRDLADKAGITSETRDRYFQSATHQEIARGALSRPTVPDNTIDPAEHVLACFRTIEGLPKDHQLGTHTDGTPIESPFVDKVNRANEMSDLKDKLREKLSQTDPGTDNVFEYGASWAPRQDGEGDIEISDRQAFAGCVLEHFTRIITAQLDGLAEVSSLEMERQAQRSFRDDRCRHFAGREETLAAIEEYGNANEVHKNVDDVHARRARRHPAESPGTATGEHLQEPIEDLDISQRAKSWLLRNGIEFLHQLVDRTESELSNSKGHGRFVRRDIERVLADRGLSLRMEGASQDIEPVLDSDQNRVIAVIGEGGSGKSALMAQLTRRLESGSGLLVYRFIGATPTSTLIDGVLHSVAEELAQAVGDTQPLPSGREELVEQLVDLLGRATAERPITVVLDALDQLTEAEARKLEWLPEKLPPHTKIVVSALPDLKAALSKTHHVALPRLSDEAGSVILDAWLAEAGRALQPEQRAAVLEGFAANGLPLYLKLAFEQARLWGSTERAPELAAGIDGMVESMLISLEADHTPGRGERTAPLVQTALGLLQASRYGLAENEVLDVLSRDVDFFEAYKGTTHHPLRENRLPIAVWSRLYLDLAPYLVEREAQGVVVLDFFHRQVGEVIGRRYGEGEADRRSHAQLAAYFGAQENYLDPTTRLSPNRRRISELVYQSLRAGETDASRDTLADFDFLAAASIGGLMPTVLFDLSDCDTVGERDNRGHVFGETADFLAAYSALMSSGDLCELLTHAIEIDTGDHLHISSRANVWLEEMATSNTSQAGFWLRATEVDPSNGNILQQWQNSTSFWLAVRNGRCLPLPERYCITWNDNQIEIWDTIYAVNKPVQEQHAHQIAAVWRGKDDQVVSLDHENNLFRWARETTGSDGSPQGELADDFLTLVSRQTVEPGMPIPVSRRSTKGIQAPQAAPSELSRFAELLREQGVEVDPDHSNIQVFEIQGCPAVAVVDDERNFVCDVESRECRELSFKEGDKHFTSHELKFQHVFPLPSGAVFFPDFTPALWGSPGDPDSPVRLIEHQEEETYPDLIVELDDRGLCLFENHQERLLLIDSNGKSRTYSYPEEGLKICEAYVLETLETEDRHREAILLLLVTEDEALVWRWALDDDGPGSKATEAVSWVKTEVLEHPPVFDLTSLVKVVEQCHSSNSDLVSTGHVAPGIARGSYLLVTTVDNITVYEVESLTALAEHIERAVFLTGENDKYILDQPQSGPTSTPLIEGYDRYNLPEPPSWPPDGSNHAKYRVPGSADFKEYLAAHGKNSAPEDFPKVSGSSQAGPGIVLALDPHTAVHWRNLRREPAGEWRARHLFPDGRVLMNNERGQLKFLQLMRWNQAISFAQAEPGCRSSTGAVDVATEEGNGGGRC